MAIYLNGQLVAGSNTTTSPFIIVDQFDANTADQTKIYVVKANTSLIFYFYTNNWYNFTASGTGVNN